MIWFLVGVLLHLFFYIQVVVDKSKAYEEDDFYCPSAFYYTSVLPQVQSCKDDSECNKNDKCCTTVIRNVQSGVELGTSSLCTTPEIRASPYGYCPPINITDQQECVVVPCETDENCGETDVCCWDACQLKTCATPTVYPTTKVGKCPARKEEGIAPHRCTTDFGCPGDQKCCGESIEGQYCYNAV